MPWTWQLPRIVSCLIFFAGLGTSRLTLELSGGRNSDQRRRPPIAGHGRCSALLGGTLFQAELLAGRQEAERFAKTFLLRVFPFG
jgi:hypothetical protein